MINAFLTQSEITHHTGRILQQHALYGGDINEVNYLKAERGEFVLKYSHQQIPDMFTAEAAGLKLLAEHKLPVPEVIVVGSAWLLLRYYAPGKSDWEEAGRKIAQLHLQPQKQCGLDFDNYIGLLPQSNTPSQDWGIFYAERRIKPQLSRLGCLKKENPDHKLWQNLLQKIPNITAKPAQLSLIHGDLWSGNLYFSELGPLFIDPAPYIGDPLVEIAFTELFGSFNHRFYQVYEEYLPLGERYRDLKKLYQLYPLLVHANLFGGSYYHSAKEIANYYV